MGRASGIKVPGLPWRDQVTALKLLLVKLAKAILSCPDQVPLRKLGSPDQVPLAPLSCPFHTILNVIVICLPTEHQGVHNNSFRNAHAFQYPIGIWEMLVL